jgi:nitrogen fixation/metabolism regulation signal transduction histidine kinase
MAPASTSPSTSTPPKVRYKRSFRNYLIDSRFQLKYTGFILILALAISAVLGAFLWTTSEAVVNQGRNVAEQSTKVVEESRKVSDVIKMQIVKDPVYGEDPELAKAFGAASTQSDNVIKQQQDEVFKQQLALVAQQRNMRFTIVGVLAVMVVLIGLLGIYFTHKVAGPIYKMKLLLGQVGAGKLNFQGRLRKGDELQEFFETFASMVEKLKERQRDETERLDAAIQAAEKAGLSADALSKLAALRDQMRKALDA